MIIRNVTVIITETELKEIETCAKTMKLHLNFTNTEILGPWNDRKYQTTISYGQEDGAYSKWRSLLRKFLYF